MAWGTHSIGTGSGRGFHGRRHDETYHGPIGSTEEKPAVPRKPVHMTAVDFVGSRHNQRAIVHYSDGTQEILREGEGRYRELKERFTPRPPNREPDFGYSSTWP
jgi:hypothetical protein